MKTTLKMAERKRVLKVTGFHESLGGFGKKLLAGMGIKKGAKFEIEPAHVSQIVLQYEGKEIQLGYESLMSVVVGDRRLTELTPRELGTISALEVGRGTLAKFSVLGLKVGTIVEVKKFVPGTLTAGSKWRKPREYLCWKSLQKHLQGIEMVYSHISITQLLQALLKA